MANVIKFKKLNENAVIPTRAHVYDAGLDLTVNSISTVVNECGQLMIVYHSGIAMEIPNGYCALLIPRSSVYKKSLWLTDNVGVIDSNYRGEIMGVFKPTTDVVPAVYKEGERFAQLVIVPVPTMEIVETDELSETDRADQGFGSTGQETLSADSLPEQNSDPAADSTEESETAE